MVVVYTPKAKESARLVMDFLVENWGLKSAENFLLKADKIINLIASQPLMFKPWELDQNIRIAVITKQTSLFYEIKGREIVLLFFYDNRQDPII